MTKCLLVRLPWRLREKRMPKDNIPRVRGKADYQNFFNSVKDHIDSLTGVKKKGKYDRALTVRDLEKFGVDLDRFLNCDKQNPYQL